MMKLKNAVWKYRAVPVATGLMTVTTAFPALAADVDASAGVTQAVSLTTSVMSIFTSYPLNVFIAGGLAIMAIGIFAKAKSASKH